MITAFFYSKSKDLELSSYVNAGEVGRYIQKPWNKFFPYGFGIIVGIIIWKYNNSNIKGTYVAKISKLIQQNSLISWSMHIIATILITTMIVTIHPIDHDRNGDTKFSSSIWLV